MAAARDHLVSALALREHAAERTPSLAGALFHLGKAERELGDQEAARAHLLQVLVLAEQLAAQLGTADTWRDIRGTLAQLVELSGEGEVAAYRARMSEVEERLERLELLERPPP